MNDTDITLSREDAEKVKAFRKKSLFRERDQTSIADILNSGEAARPTEPDPVEEPEGTESA